MGRERVSVGVFDCLQGFVRGFMLHLLGVPCCKLGRLTHLQQLGDELALASVLEGGVHVEISVDARAINAQKRC
jgi:hypothetical protein